MMFLSPKIVQLSNIPLSLVTSLEKARSLSFISVNKKKYFEYQSPCMTTAFTSFVIVRYCDWCVYSGPSGNDVYKSEVLLHYPWLLHIASKSSCIKLYGYWLCYCEEMLLASVYTSLHWIIGIIVKTGSKTKNSNDHNHFECWHLHYDVFLKKENI